ncbi:MAG: hypothetical protein HeimC3_45480 [Candidatus Heimdallarchaeota archaeon LC_3]|nr:MAG: hypothetical protein HeimC3_45480 [Candidatus Heimdallarchaeota archaeon LC_3]
MITTPLVVIFCLTGVGVGIHKINKKWTTNLSYNELIINSLVISSGILIIPLVIFGLWDFPILFSSWVYFYAIVSIISYIYIIYKSLKTILFNLNSQQFKFDIRSNRILIVGIIIFCIYILYAVFLPLRGYDALWMYLPDALWYYQTDSIPLFNLLNFRPAVKEPIPSLFYTFSLYITQDFIINFIPLIFILSWSLLAVEFVKFFWPEHPRSLQWFVWPIFLIFPLNIWFMDNWAYYQDIYLGFFFSSAIYYYLKLINSNNVKNRRYYYLLLIFSIILSLFTKVSAWYLFILFILLIPGKKNIKISQTLVCLGLLAFLSAQVTYRSFIGYSLIIFFIGIFIIYFIWTKKEITLRNANYLPVIGSISIGLIIGSIWLIENFQRYKTASNTLFSEYFSVIPDIQYDYLSNSLNNPGFIIETSQSASFFAGVFIILIGNYFALFWLLPKIRGFFSNKNNSEITIWILSIFILWITYYHNGSQRYLTPLIIPIILLIYIGIIHLWEDITIFLNKFKHFSFKYSLKDIPFLYKLIFLLLGTLTLYFPLSFESISNLNSSNSSLGHLYLESAFNYYKNWFIVGLVGILIPIVLFLIIILAKFISEKKSLKYINNNKIHVTFSSLIVILLFIIPLIIPTFVYFSSNNNINEFQQNYAFENRDSVHEILNKLLEENDKKEAVLVINTPGIPVWTSIPVIDFTSQKELLIPLYEKKNISNGLNLLLHPLSYITSSENITINNENLIPAIKYVIIPNIDNFVFSYYNGIIKQNSYLFSIINDPRYFTENYRNNEFIIYERIYNIPSFIGPFEIELESELQRLPIVGEIFQEKSLGKNLVLRVNWDLSDINPSTISFKHNIHVKLFDSKELIWINSTNTNTTGDYSMFHVSLINFDTNIEQIKEIVLEINYTDSSSKLISSQWHYLAPHPIVLKIINNDYIIFQGNGLVLEI